MNKNITTKHQLVTAALIFLLLVLFLSTGQKHTETVPIMKGTPVAAEMLVINSRQAGKTILVIAGIHGDETAGITAGEQLKKIKRLNAGTLLLLSPANTPGAKNGERNVEQHRDLNRSFPGEKNRDLTDQLAADIFRIVREYQPDIILDLHEASREEGNRDFLGNSLIFTDLSGMEELVPGLVTDTQSGTLCSSPFTYYGPAPAGSLNREVTERLTTPVLTIETAEDDPMQRRVDNHLALVHAVMQHYGLE